MNNIKTWQERISEEYPAANNLWRVIDPIKYRDAEVAELRAALAAAHQQQEKASAPVSAPDGWKLVPVEPTPEMIAAMASSQAHDDEGEFPSLADLIDFSGENKTRAALKAAFAAMLAAAPAIQKPQDERAAFEAWACSDNGGGWDDDSALAITECGTFYRDDNLQIAFDAWQARAALTKKGGAQ